MPRAAVMEAGAQAALVRVAASASQPGMAPGVPQASQQAAVKKVEAQPRAAVSASQPGVAPAVSPVSQQQVAKLRAWPAWPRLAQVEVLPAWRKVQARAVCAWRLLQAPLTLPALSRLTAMLIAIFAGLALVITLAGISGVMALAVSQRTREIGIRMALGATRERVLRMVLWQGMVLVAIGLAIGFGAALASTHFVASQLYGLSEFDPASFLGAAALLAAVAELAGWIPARRAARVDPVRALRHD